MQARLVSVRLSLEIMSDDGITLEHVQVDPIIVPAAHINTLPDGVRLVVKRVQEQLDAQTPPALCDEAGKPGK